VQLNEEFIKHKEKFELLLTVTATQQGEAGFGDNPHERLADIAAYVL